MITPTTSPPKSAPRLLRQIVEQSQGLPSIARELVKRVAARGDLSLNAIRREDLHGAKPLDMTPGPSDCRNYLPLAGG